MISTRLSPMPSMDINEDYIIDGISIKALVSEIDKFNGNSVATIALTIKRIPSYSEPYAIIGNYPYAMRPEFKFDFMFEIKDLYSSGTTITAYSTEQVASAFELSKLICTRTNITFKIDSLVQEHCASVINGYEKHTEDWNKYLANWHHQRHWESFSETMAAYDKFSCSLKGEIKEHLKLHYPEVLKKINELNKQLAKGSARLVEIKATACLHMDTEFSGSYACNFPRYAYNFNEEIRYE